MANYLASIFGTEQDKVNCSFYYKIGACRHGDRCSRKHVKPSYSQTILLPNLYQNPAYDPKNKMNPSQLQNHFDAFYEDFWCEMCKFGEPEEVVVCDNNNDRTSFLSLSFFPSSPQILHHSPINHYSISVLILPSFHRSNRQRLRALQIRRFRAKSLRRPQLALVRRPPHLLRAQPRDGFPGSLLSLEQRRGLRAGRVLQFHSSQSALRGAGTGVGVGDEEVVEGQGQG